MRNGERLSIALVVALLSGGLVAADLGTANVSKPSVEVHQGPDFKTPAIATLGQNASVTVSAQQGLWFKVQTADGKVAVRNDHIRLTEAGITGWTATVSDVEYQGTYVLLGLQLDGDSADRSVSVMLPEAAFVDRPWTTGERADLSWDPTQAHALAA